MNTSASQQRAAGSTVLHLEDDPMLAQAVRTLLCIAGHEAHWARNSEEALDLVAQHGLRPDVLIVDFNLGEERTGSDVAEELVQIVGYPIPMILLSAQLANSEVPWMPGAPILLISKPIDPALLLETVATFGQWHRFERTQRLQPQPPHLA